MTTGEIIQNRRKQSGWSQDQLAQKLGISRQSISKWEQDLALPDLENGLKLCETLGITVEELLHPISVTKVPNIASENSFQSAEKFIKKTLHFSGLYVALIGFLFTAAGSLFQMITQAMNKQAQSSLDSLFGGFPRMFGNIRTDSVLSPFIGWIIGAGVVIMMIGVGIFLYGRSRKQNA